MKNGIKLFLLGLCLISSSAAFAATLYVDDDYIAPLAPSFNTVESAVTNSSSGDVILVAPGTYVLNQEIEITKSITIQGTSSNVILTTDGDNRHFVLNANGIYVTLNRLSLYDGNPNGNGGSIYISLPATLNLINLIASGNKTTVGDGGFLMSNAGNNARIYMINSLIKNNRAQYGGAVSWGTWSVKNSVFYNNTADQGSLANNGIWWNVENSVIASHNTTAGGDLVNLGSWNVFNTIFYRNHNHVFNGSVGGFGYCSFDQNMINANLMNQGNNRLLKPDFVSPETDDFRLSNRSHLIEAGNPSIAVAQDFNGVTRPAFNRQDIGAFEFQGLTVIDFQPELATINIVTNSPITFSVVESFPGTTVVTASITATINNSPIPNGSFNFSTVTDGVRAVYTPAGFYPPNTRIYVTINAQDTSSNTVQKIFYFKTAPVPIAFNISHGSTLNYFSLQSAVLSASANDTILVTPGIHTEDGTITITRNLTIRSLSGVSTNTAVDGGKTHRIFMIDNGAVVTISALTIQNGYQTFNNGSGITLINGTLFLENIRALTNTSNSGPGGFLLIASPQKAYINHSYFEGNYSDNGGAIHNNGGLVVEHSTFINNVAASNTGGSAITNESTGTATLNANLFKENTSQGEAGGAIANRGGTVLSFNNIYLKNHGVKPGDSAGGAIFNYGTFSSYNDIFVQNDATSLGGAIANDFGGNMIIRNAIFYANQAPVASQIYYGSGSMSIQYSDMPSGNSGVTGFSFETGPGNLTADPLFTDITNENFRLQPGSALINAGASNNFANMDYAGLTRPVGMFFDIGVFEFNGLQISPVSPVASQIQVPVLPTIVALVNDFENQIVTTSITLEFNDSFVTLQTNGTVNSTNISFTPPTSLNYLTTYRVTISAQNTLAQTVVRSYIFTTRGPPAVRNLQTLAIYDDVQSALDAASPGQTLEVFSTLNVLGNVIWPNIDNLTLQGQPGLIPTPSLRAAVPGSVIAFATPVSASVRNLMITGGTEGYSGYGGGIVIDSPTASIRLDSVIVSGNQVGGTGFGNSGGGGLAIGSGYLYVYDSQFKNNQSTDSFGGGIIVIGSNAHAEIYRSHIASNNSVLGAGLTVFDGGQVTLSATLIEQNYAQSLFGIYGGAAMLIHNNNARAYLENCTLAGNAASGNLQNGILIIDQSQTSLVNSIVHNGGISEIAILPQSTPGTATTLYSNIQGANGSEPWWDASDTTANPLFVNQSGRDYRLQSGSPLIDTGTGSLFYSGPDLAGTSRPQGLGFDRGAFEFTSAIPPINIVFNQTQGMLGYPTLTGAVAAAQSGDTLLITPGIHAIPTEVVISISLNIQSTTGVSTDVVLDGGNSSRIFNINNANVTLNALTLQNGQAGVGGGIYLNGTGSNLYMNRIRGLNSIASGAGGFIRSESGTVLRVFESRFSGNQSDNDGGAIQSLGSLLVSGSVFTNNLSRTLFGGGGGAIGFSNFSGTANILNSYFRDNVASNNGGAVLILGFLQSHNNVFINNTAHSTTLGGGAIGTFVLMDQDSYYLNNHADNYGGAIGAFIPPDINGSIFKNNSASANGGAIYSPGFANVPFNIRNTLFVGNHATVQGGALFLAGDSTSINHQIYQNVFYGNQANGAGGAIFVSLNARVSGNNNIFMQNQDPLGHTLVIHASSLVEISHSLLTSGNASINGPFDFESAPGNLTGNALFVNPAADDFHLQPGSPAMDSGTTNALVTTDFSGTARPQGSAYDMGIFEQATVLMTDSSPPTLTPLHPLAGASNVPINTNVSFNITDNASGVSLNTLRVSVNNTLAINQGIALGAPFPATISPSGLGFNIFINPNSDFLNTSTVTVRVFAQDVSGNILNTSYSFTTVAATPPTSNYIAPYPISVPTIFDPSVGETTQLMWPLDRNRDVTLRIYDLNARNLLQRYFNSGTPGGSIGNNTYIWNGRDELGRMLSTGIYYFYLIGIENGQQKALGRGNIIIRKTR